MQMHNNEGFTFIELMVVIAVMGILAVLANSYYQDGVAKGQVAEALGLITGYKGQVMEYYISTGVCPLNRKAVSYGVSELKRPIFPEPTKISGKYVKAVIITKSSVTNTCGIWAEFRGSGTSSVIKSKFIVNRVVKDSPQGCFEWECISQV